MIYDPLDTRIALDHHGRLLVSRIVGRDSEGRIQVDWCPTITLNFRGEQKGEDFTRPAW